MRGRRGLGKRKPLLHRRRASQRRHCDESAHGRRGTDVIVEPGGSAPGSRLGRIGRRLRRRRRRRSRAGSGRSHGIRQRRRTLPHLGRASVAARSALLFGRDQFRSRRRQRQRIRIVPAIRSGRPGGDRFGRRGVSRIRHSLVRSGRISLLPFPCGAQRQPAGHRRVSARRGRRRGGQIRLAVT